MSYAVIRVSDFFVQNFGTDTCIEWLCFDKWEDRWYLSEDKHQRWEFDLSVDAVIACANFDDSDTYLTVIPIAEKPVSAKTNAKHYHLVGIAE